MASAAKAIAKSAGVALGGDVICGLQTQSHHRLKSKLIGATMAELIKLNREAVQEWFTFEEASKRIYGEDAQPLFIQEYILSGKLTPKFRLDTKLHGKIFNLRSGVFSEIELCEIADDESDGYLTAKFILDLGVYSIDKDLHHLLLGWTDDYAHVLLENINVNGKLCFATTKEDEQIDADKSFREPITLGNYKQLKRKNSKLDSPLKKPVLYKHGEVVFSRVEIEALIDSCTLSVNKKRLESKQQSESKLQTDEELLAEYRTRIKAGEKGVVATMASARGCSTQRIYALVNRAKEKNKHKAFDNLYKRNQK